MSNYGSNSFSFFLIGGYDFKGLALKEVIENVEAVLDDLTALGDTWARPVSAGTYKAILGIKGLYDDNAAYDGNLLQVGLSFHVCYGVEGNVAGKHLVDFNKAVLKKYARLPVTNKLHRSEAEFERTGTLLGDAAQFAIGQVLHPLVPETVAPNYASAAVDHNTDTEAVTIPITSATKANPCIVTTTVPHGLTTGQVVVGSGNTLAAPDINGELIVTVLSPTTFSVGVNTSGSSGAGTGGQVVLASTVNGGIGIFHVTSLVLGGYTNLSLSVDHSVDGAAWNQLAVQIVTTVGGFRVLVAAGTTVRRYLRAAYGYTGAGAGPQVNFLTGFVRN